VQRRVFQQAKKPDSKPSIFTEFEKPKRHKIKRLAFETSRLMEFCSERELVNQTAHEASEWPLVIVKELIDNSLDACEEAEIPPVLEVRIDADNGVIQIVDNGPGIPATTVTGILDYSVRVSSREAYVSPTRGAQGNALKTILAMAFVRDGDDGRTLIEAQGLSHSIKFRVDQIRLEPTIDLRTKRSATKNGTRFTVFWPNIQYEGDESYIDGLEQNQNELIELVSNFTWLNPHLSLQLFWNDELLLNHIATNAKWTKWLPCDPTSAHWYDQQRFERYMAAHIASQEKHGREKFTVRDFIAEFRGLTSTIKRKRILTRLGTAHTSLADFFGSSHKVNHEQITLLLKIMQDESKKVPPKHLGVIGKEHLFRMLETGNGQKDTFQYRRKFNVIDGVPRVIEVAFAVLKSGLSDPYDQSKVDLHMRYQRRRFISAVNWSAAIGNPFRQLGHHGEGLDGFASKLYAGSSEPIIALVHLACPRVAYLDRGKSSIVVD